jgi:calcineurin-like phosphoesterase family protein
MKKFYTSDNHFFHKKILDLQRHTRLGSSMEEMHELMIDKWNNQVSENDEVFILGDMFFLGGKQWSKIYSTLDRLKGIKHLIVGNHDHFALTVDDTELLKYFYSIQSYKEEKIGDTLICMMHYPIYRWNRQQYGSIHLHGHTHGSYQGEGKILDVGIDNRPNCDMGLWELEEILDFMINRPVLRHH